MGFDPLAAARLIEEATRRSQTVRSLVDALDRSDVIVLVELVPTLPHPSGRTTLQGATPTVRYVRVTIASSNPLYDQIKWLAHELTHAWEIAEAPDVRDAVGLQRLMLRICSMSNVAGTRFETARAVAAGRKALAEASAMPVLTLAPRIP